MIDYIQRYLGISAQNSFLVELTACLLLVGFVIIVVSTLFGVLLNFFPGGVGNGSTHYSNYVHLGAVH